MSQKNKHTHHLEKMLIVHQGFEFLSLKGSALTLCASLQPIGAETLIITENHQKGKGMTITCG